MAINDNIDTLYETLGLEMFQNPIYIGNLTQGIRKKLIINLTKKLELLKKIG